MGYKYVRSVEAKLCLFFNLTGVAIFTLGQRKGPWYLLDRGLNGYSSEGKDPRTSGRKQAAGLNI